MPGKRILKLTSGVLAVAVLVGGVSIASDWRLWWRWATYDYPGPLQVPVEWYDPTDLVQGAQSDLALVPSPSAIFSESAATDVLGYAEAQNATVLIAVQNGQLAFEGYFQNSDRETLFNPQSMSKSVLGLLMGIAIDEGHVKSVGDPIKNYVEEWADDPRGAITIQQLLWMSGGLEQMGADGGAFVPWSKVVRYNLGSDFDGMILDLPQKDQPGEVFEYNNEETNLLGIVLERATGKRYAEYLSDKIWRPLGLADAHMYLDRPGGSVMKSCCILSRPIDWAKLGMLVLNKGRYDGKQIVPAAWIDQMITPSPLKSGYGYQIWLGNNGVADEPPADAFGQLWMSEAFAADDVISFWGHGFQRVWIIPSYDLVVVRGGWEWPERFDDSYVVNRLIRDLDRDLASR